MENKNKFTSKGDIIGGIVLYGIFVLFGGYLLYDNLSLTEDEFVKWITDYTGSASGTNIKDRAIVNLVYTFGGKTGYIIFMTLGTSFFYFL